MQRSRLAVALTAFALSMVQLQAFYCNYCGCGSTFGYPDETCTFSSGVQETGLPITNQNTCCQCDVATTALNECNVGKGNDYGTFSCADEYACDAHSPSIDLTAGATQASTPGLWFTSEEQLQAFANRGSLCTDDCWSVEDGTLACTIETFPSESSCAQTGRGERGGPVPPPPP